MHPALAPLHRKPCTHAAVITALNRLSSKELRCAISEAIIPVNLSPDPPAAKPRFPTVAIVGKPDGATITVPAPLKTQIVPNCLAKRSRYSSSTELFKSLAASFGCGVSTSSDGRPTRVPTHANTCNRSASTPVGLSQSNEKLTPRYQMNADVISSLLRASLAMAKPSSALLPTSQITAIRLACRPRT